MELVRLIKTPTKAPPPLLLIQTDVVFNSAGYRFYKDAYKFNSVEESSIRGSV